MESKKVKLLGAILKLGMNRAAEDKVENDARGRRCPPRVVSK